MSIRKIVKHTKNLDVASNEHATKYSAQRIFNRLLENDRLLEEFYNNVFGNAQIYQYQYGTEYSYNDLVWFVDKNKDLSVLRFNRTSTKSLDAKFRNLNAWTRYSYVNGALQYISPARYGWVDLNPEIDILKDFGLDKAINTFLMRRFKQHTEDETKHPYGKIFYSGQLTTDIEKKIARSDLANVNPHRENTFFPYHTFYLNPSKDDPIMSGNCRRYDNGLLEYDLVFRLSYAGNQLVDSEYGIYSDVLSANMLDLGKNNMDQSYYLTFNDAAILMPKGIYVGEADIGETVQRNRNDYVNVYSAYIDFADKITNNPYGLDVKFKDASSYMIFSSDIMCQDNDSDVGAMHVNPNQLCFCHKTPQSFCAFFITYGKMSKITKAGYNATQGGLQSNSFHCKLIGRYR